MSRSSTSKTSPDEHEKMLEDQNTKQSDDDVETSNLIENETRKNSEN